MERGDVVRAQLPRPRGYAGHEQFGPRPAIIVQDELEFLSLSTVLIVPLTSRQSALSFDGTFPVAPSEENGLSLQSVVLSHQLRALDRSRVEEVIGKLSSSDMATLEVSLRRLLRL